MLGLQHVVTLDIRLQHIAVAPPRGVRGLKYIEKVVPELVKVAPPRGVRGLKLLRRRRHRGGRKSHPLVGCVD